MGVLKYEESSAALVRGYEAMGGRSLTLRQPAEPDDDLGEARGGEGADAQSY